LGLLDSRCARRPRLCMGQSHQLRRHNAEIFVDTEIGEMCRGWSRSASCLGVNCAGKCWLWTDSEGWLHYLALTSLRGRVDGDRRNHANYPRGFVRDRVANPSVCLMNWAVALHCMGWIPKEHHSASSSKSEKTCVKHVTSHQEGASPRGRLRVGRCFRNRSSMSTH
jgi:hypothetical protein